VCVTTSIERQIAQELAVRGEQVAAAVALLDGGATVPFIAPYRKEATGALAEPVKIDPKSIGVGQYQHDLSEYKLSRSLDAVVEDCV
jgi:transcriptional accessory protein Tex/SPT6